MNNGVEYEPIPVFKFRLGEKVLATLQEVRISRLDVFPIYSAFIHTRKVGATRFILISLGWKGRLLEIRQRGLHIDWTLSDD